MQTFKDVLFPIDLADEVERPLRYAGNLARDMGARLHLLFVVREFDFARGIFIPHENIDRMEEEFRSTAQTHMERVRASHFGDDANVNAAVAFGSPAEEIIKYAAGHGIDMILLMTHGRTGLQHAIFGSVAEKVIRLSHIPVLVVRPERMA
jgi:nucleotide-binding universal stress UspA family protein